MRLGPLGSSCIASKVTPCAAWPLLSWPVRQLPQRPPVPAHTSTTAADTAPATQTRKRVPVKMDGAVPATLPWKKRLIARNVRLQVCAGAEKRRSETHACRLCTGACPTGTAWAPLPTGTTFSRPQAECSGKGLCNRVTGQCRCFAGYTGAACQRSACPNACSGHGRCLSMKQAAIEGHALPLGPGGEYSAAVSSRWDATKVHGCVCDSAWSLGFGPSDVQATSWFGVDCSLRRWSARVAGLLLLMVPHCSAPASLRRPMPVLGRPQHCIQRCKRERRDTLRIQIAEWGPVAWCGLCRHRHEPAEEQSRQPMSPRPSGRDRRELRTATWGA